MPPKLVTIYDSTVLLGRIKLPNRVWDQNSTRTVEAPRPPSAPVAEAVVPPRQEHDCPTTGRGIRANKLDEEKAAANYRLPVEAVREALAYVEENRRLLEDEADIERLMLKR